MAPGIAGLLALSLASAACAEAERGADALSPHPPLANPPTVRDLEGLWSRDPDGCRVYAVLVRGGSYDGGGESDAVFPGTGGKTRWQLNGSALTLSYDGRDPVTVQVARDGDRSLRVTGAGGKSHVITRCKPGSVVYEMFGLTGTETDSEICAQWVPGPERDRVCRGKTKEPTRP
jgi:hypothetical protein